jgi:hypothetical protein
MDTQVSTHQAEDDARNEDILIWVNGQLKPRAAATVNVHDAGFMPGDGKPIQIGATATEGNGVLNTKMPTACSVG